MNGGAFFFLTLPNSKIEVDIPLVAVLSDVQEPDSGLDPDVTVELTPAAVHAGRDLVLERAIELLRVKNR